MVTLTSDLEDEQMHIPIKLWLTIKEYVSFYRRLIYSLSYQWEIAPNSMVHNLFEGIDKT